MSGFIGRTFLLFFILTAFLAMLLTYILGWPSYDNWYLLLSEEGDLPIAIWIAISLLSISMGTAISSTTLARKRERTVDNYLQAVTNTDQQNDGLAVPKVSSKLHKTLGDVSTLIATQKRSLQRMSDERAEGEDKRIQERIIQERQRLARELHDSVSQQLLLPPCC
jgi:two-component system vancomycin resistance sensor histidine kinase VraS/NarL family two-component system sensor histidine kinase LiaS